jgi:hypothetical protein
VLPVVETGGEDAVVKKRLRRLRRLDIQLRMGEPFTLPPLPARGREAALQQGTDEIMCQIAALLPPEYRGVYAGHPRLAERSPRGEEASRQHSCLTPYGIIVVDKQAAKDDRYCLQPVKGATDTQRHHLF